MNMPAKEIVIIALCTALLVIVSPLSIYIGAIPISFTTLVIFTLSAVFGGKRALLFTLAFVMLGAFGVPCFSFFTGGFAVLFGATGGFIIGYVPCSFIVGYGSQKFKRSGWAVPLSMAVGLIVCYILGTLWYMNFAKVNLFIAFSVCVIPFIAIDVVKILVATIISKQIIKRLNLVK